MGEFEVNAISSGPTLLMGQICRWHLCHLTSRTLTSSSSTSTAIPFLDTLVSLWPNNTLTAMVYHKPTHTGQYLHWVRNHFLAAKHSVYNTLTHRARVVCTSQHTFQQEEDHIRQALLKWNFPPIGSQHLNTKFYLKQCTDHTQMVDNTQHNNSATTNSRNIFLVVPYSKGLSKRFNKTCRSLGIQVHFKARNTICNLLVAPKDKDSTMQKSG